MKADSKLYHFIYFIVVFFGGILLAFLSLACIFNQVFITMNGAETVIFQKNGPGIILLLVLQTALLVGMGFVIKRVPERMIFGVLALGYLVAGLYMIFQVDAGLRADAYSVYHAALHYNQGNYVDFEPGQYLFRFPFQLGLMTYDRILAFISQDIRFFYALNLVWVLCTNFFLWRISKVLFEEKPLVHKYTILLSFAFLPQFFFILFVYGQVPGLVCVVAAVYFMLKQFKGQGRYNWLWCILFATLANFLKSNYKIAIIAMLAVYFCCFLVQKKKQYLFTMAGMLLAVLVSGKILTACYELDMGQEIGKGTPMIMWVAMGLQDDESSTTQGGWINGYNIYRFNDVGYDYDLATQRALTSIHRSAIRFWEEPAYCVRFFVEKIISTWCDPMYQSVWSGPLVAESDRDGRWLDEVYSGGQAYTYLATWCNGIVVLILGLALVAVIDIVRHVEKTERMLYLFPVIYLLGGFLFHVFWETKSQYVYMYVLCLVPLSAYGLNMLYEKAGAIAAAKKKSILPGLIMLMALQLTGCGNRNPADSIQNEVQQTEGTYVASEMETQKSEQPMLTSEETGQEDMIEGHASEESEVIAEPEKQEATIVMVGDMLLHTQVNNSGKQEDGTYNYDHLFTHVAEEIQAADLALVNQEVILSGTEAGLRGYPRFNGAFELGDSLVDAGFDVILHATNHAMDMGKDGLLRCADFWENTYPEIGVVGIYASREEADTVYITEVNGIRIAVLNYTYGTNGITLPADMPYAVDLWDEEEIAKDIALAKEEADFIVVCPHWGTEYVFEETSKQRKWAQFLAEQGVDLCIGTHPHVIEPVEWVTGANGNEMLVYYSIGNFINATSGTASGVSARMLGAMAQVTVTMEQGDCYISAYDALPLIAHVEKETKENNTVTTYPLDEYTEELAARHYMNEVDPDNFSITYFYDLFEQVFGEL